MRTTGLSDHELGLLRGVFRHVPTIREVVLFGSRAKGSHRYQSDVDLALVGVTNDLTAEAIAEVLEALPMPYRFDVKAYDNIRYPSLLAHIKRVGVTIFQRENCQPMAGDQQNASVVAALRELGLGGLKNPLGDDETFSQTITLIDMRCEIL